MTQIKIAEPRQRPNRLDNESFPSGHSARASSKRHLIAHNLEASDINPHVRNGINTINGLMTASVMWARVEANKHHLSDVLAGYSVGYFLSGVFYDSLLNLDTAETFVVVPSTDKVMALYSVSF
ncbi:MAG: phosphatase PAP2 family protein [Bacteriovoracia bacterium]